MSMSRRDEVAAIRVVMVATDGRDCAFSALGAKLSSISPDGFVAIDTEFSGLGGDPDTNHDNLQRRYQALRRIAHRRALFSVGVSIFNPTSLSPTINDGTHSPVTYDVANFDFLLSCQSPYEMAPTAGSFLVAHGFDFNRMFRSGIPYHRASRDTSETTTAEDLTGTKTELTMTPPTGSSVTSVAGIAGESGRHIGGLPYGILWRIGRMGVPIIVHNGLLDLVFLYAALEGSLPPTLNDFVGLLLECVPCGFWDTKVLATESAQRATYLNYLFARSVVHGQVSVENARGLPSSFQTDPPVLDNSLTSDSLCALFAFRGFCPRGIECPFAHDAFRVVEEERNGGTFFDSKDAYRKYKEQSKVWKKQKGSKLGASQHTKKQRKRVQAKMNKSSTAAQGSDSINSDSDNMTSPTCTTTEGHGKAHTAGWDAFCTGYIFASFRASLSPGCLQKNRNYIALPNRLSNLLIRKSEYAELDGNNTCN